MYNEVIKPQLTEYLYRKAYISKTPLSGAFEISVRLNYLLFAIWIVKCVMLE